MNNTDLIKLYGDPKDFPISKKQIHIFTGPDELNKYRFWLIRVSNYNVNRPDEDKLYYKCQIFHSEIPEEFEEEMIKYDELNKDIKYSRKYRYGYQHSK